MKDSVIKGTGNSRYLKSVANLLTLYPTYEDFAQALIAGTFPIDLNGINAAGFQQVGTALNKASFLKDATAELYGLDASAVPDDLFQVLASQGRYKIGVNVTVNGTPAPGVTIGGITSGSGGAVTTDSKGYAEGYTTEKTVTLTVAKLYADVPSKSVTVNTNGHIFSRASIALTSTPGQIEVTSSQVVRFSPAVEKVDIFAVGGGGSGAIDYERNAEATGGSGGYTATKLGVAVVNRQVTVSIGAGGEPSTVKSNMGGSSWGKNGGTTTVTTGSVVVSAAGGRGGQYTTGVAGGSGSGGVDNTNNNVGKGGTNGGDGESTYNYAGGKGQGKTTTAFEEGTGTQYCAAGAGATGDYSHDEDMTGGAGPGGGSGYSSYGYGAQKNLQAGSGSLPGCGGGGFAIGGPVRDGTVYTYSSGAGADGIAILRWGK